MTKVKRDWTPRLSADGVHYCSHACGGGKFCTKAAYDLAVERAEQLAATMGEGWGSHVWENLGWHYSVSKGCMTIIPNYFRGQLDSYSAWISPRGVPLQIIEKASDPQDALGIAKQKAWDAIIRVREALADLEGATHDEG